MGSITGYTKAGMDDVLAPVDVSVAQAVAAAQAASESAASAATSASEAEHVIADPNDAAVATLVQEYGTTTTPSTTALALNRQFNKSQYGNRWCFDGDSISVMGSTGAWIDGLIGLSGGRILMAANPAVAGRTTTQALLDFETKIRPLAGTIDVVCYEEVTHSITAGLTVDQFLALLDQYLAKVISIGCKMVLTSGFPNDTQGTIIEAWDRSMLAWANKNNVIFIPIYTLSDIANSGKYPTNWSTDGIHPNVKGAGVIQISKLAWKTVEPYLADAPAIPVAQYNGEGLCANGFNLTMGGTIAGVVSALTATPTVGTGNLPAGSYTYRAAPANYNGKNASYADAQASLTATGEISVQPTAGGTYSAIDIYRKGPNDAQFLYVGSITTTGAAFVDTGVLAAGVAPWVDGDFTVAPSGWGVGLQGFQENIPRVITVPGVRGNMYQLPNAWTLAQPPVLTSNYSVFPIVVTGGTTIELSFKLRVNIDPADLPTTSSVPDVRLQITPSGNGGPFDILAVARDGDIYTGYWRGTLPTAATGLNIILNGSPINLHGMAIGELYVNVVPSDS